MRQIAELYKVGELVEEIVQSHPHSAFRIFKTDCCTLMPEFTEDLFVHRYVDEDVIEDLALALGWRGSITQSMVDAKRSGLLLRFLDGLSADELYNQVAFLQRFKR